LQAEEITLTIGQAFELAYRRFLETSGKELAVQHRIQSLQDRNSQLESENGELKRRLQDLVALAPQVRFCVLAGAQRFTRAVLH
jgi:PTB domain-containing engulfment adapter protein 1